MDHFEMVEKLSQKANVTYEEAKNTLEMCDWDILDALVMLEAAGKVNTEAASAAQYTTQPQPQPQPQTDNGKQEFVSGAEKFCSFLRTLFKKGNSNNFVISRHQEELLSLPLTVMVLLVLCLWPASMVLLIIGLFCGMRYRFEGPSFTGNAGLNRTMDQVADLVQKEKKSEE